MSYPDERALKSPRIIGISGLIGHGKDTIADYLVRVYGYKKLRMSDPLKREILDRLPRTLSVLRDFNYPGELKPTFEQMVYDLKPAGVRELLQEYGTEVRRADDPDYWVAQWMRAARNYDRVVVPDVRFVNEARAVRAMGGQLWCVRRPGPILSGSHESERFALSWVDWDACLLNNGTIADLEAEVARQL